MKGNTNKTRLVYIFSLNTYLRCKPISQATTNKLYEVIRSIVAADENCGMFTSVCTTCATAHAASDTEKLYIGMHAKLAENNLEPLTSHQNRGQRPKEKTQHLVSRKCLLSLLDVTRWIISSNIPHDRCRGLNQSLTRMSGPDNTIRPTYSVVRRMWAITLSYVGNKQCLGPRTTKLWPTSDSTMVHKQHITCMLVGNEL